MLSHQGRNIFWASEWAIIFPMRALPSIAILEVFYQAGQGKARLKCQLKCFWRLKCRQGLKPRLDPGQTGGQKKKVWKIFYQLFITDFYEKIGSNMSWNDWSWHPSSHSATATSDITEDGRRSSPAQFSKLRNYQIWGQDGQLYIFSSPAAPLSHPSLKIEIMLFWTLSRLDSARVMVTLVTSPCGDYWPPPMGLLTIISDCNRLLSTTVELSRTWLRHPLCFVLFHENLLNVRSYLNNLFLVTKPFFM